MAIAEQWENVSRDASSTVSKINSYRKLTPLYIRAWGGGETEEALLPSFSAGDVGADQYGPKCFSLAFTEFDSNDNVVPPNQMTNAPSSPSHTHCFYFPLEPPE